MDTTKKSGITNATFALPLQRIGSETNAVQATIDNVNVTAADMYNKSKWTGTTNSETTYNNVEGLLLLCVRQRLYLQMAF